jgi:hypothetical protein
MPEAAFVAVTVQVGETVAFTVSPLMMHPVPTTETATVPEPDPPAVVMVIGAPATPVSVVLEIDSARCDSALKVKLTDGLVTRG